MSLCSSWPQRFLVVVALLIGATEGFGSGSGGKLPTPRGRALPRRKAAALFLGSPSSFDESAAASPPVPMNTPARQSLPEHLSLIEIPGKGLGVVAKTKIPAGSVVGDYKGEVMTEDEKDRRYLASRQADRRPEDLEWERSRLERGQTITGSYLYGVVLPSGGHLFVDAEDEFESLWTRFLNHASPPLNNVNPKSIHESWDGKPRVWFVATRDIEPGEEICFDYGDDYWLPGDEVV